MPFTIGGDWLPNEPEKEKIDKSKTIKVRVQKRKKALLTCIFNLPLTTDEKKDLIKDLKKKCASGGSIKDGVIEIQGSKEEQVKGILIEKGYKVP
jgi:translation initiation factor 1